MLIGIREKHSNGIAEAGTKRSANQQSARRTQIRARVPQALSGVRQRKKERFTALLHRVNVGTPWAALYALKRKAAAGVDGVSQEAGLPHARLRPATRSLASMP